MRRSTSKANLGQAGTTLLEIVVALAVSALLVLGALALFDLTYRLSHAHLDDVSMQESSRVAQGEIVRLVRMAGRGGLPAHLALTVRDNVPPGSRLLDGEAPSPELLAGTDVLSVRGVFSTAIVQADPTDAAGFGFDSADGTGFVVVAAEGPTGVPQPLAHLAAAPAGESLLLASADERIFAVVRLTGADEGGDGSLRLRFRTAAETDALSAGGAFPPKLRQTRVAFVGLLEELRFYVWREAGDDPSAPGVERLSRARLDPGTERPHRGRTSSLRLDLADGVIDLQVAASSGGIRISTLVKSLRPVRGHRSPVGRIENHLYGDNADNPYTTDAERAHRRRLAHRRVEPRNL